MSMYDLPDNYLFSEADVNAHWELFRKIMNEEDLTADEQEFYNVIDDADRRSRIIKRMPTMGELKQWWKDEDAKKTDQPAYASLMVKHGLLSPRVSSVDAFGLWMRLCEDEVVRQRSRKMAAAKRPAYLASFASGYAHAEFVLKQISAKDLAALKVRLGVRA